jgi:hypothetical protein
VCSSVVERCPDKTEVESPILSTRTRLSINDDVVESVRVYCGKNYFLPVRSFMRRWATRTIPEYREYMDETAKQKGGDTRIALFLFAKISGWIAVPVIVSLYVGNWLDSKFSSGNTFFLLLTACAFVVSLVGIVRAAKEIESNMQRNK